MRNLNRLILLGAGLALAAPSAAQIVGRRDYGPPRPPERFVPDSRLPSPSPRQETNDLRRRIERAQDSGALSHREARQLRREARQIDRLARRYARDGLSQSERAEIETRARVLRDSVNRPRP
jgi:hypothetical protein